MYKGLWNTYVAKFKYIKKPVEVGVGKAHRKTAGEDNNEKRPIAS